MAGPIATLRIVTSESSDYDLTHAPTTGAPLFFQLFDNAVEVPSPTTEALGDAERTIWGKGNTDDVFVLDAPFGGG